MITAGSSWLDIALAAAIVLVNLVWLVIFGSSLTQRYLPGLQSLTLIWPTLLLGAILLYGGSFLSLGARLPTGTAMFTLGWISALIDGRTRRLPDMLTALMGLEAVTALLLGSLIQSVNPHVWLNALAGALLWTAVVGLGWRLKQMGLGDLKLAPVLGFILGCGSWGDAGLALALAFLIGGLHGLVASVRGGRGLRIPFGPSMLSAAMATWLASALLGPVSLLLLTT